MNQSRKSSPVSSAMLMLTALIWGVAFVAQSEGMNYVGEFTFNAVRFLIGGAVLVPCILTLRRIEGARAQGHEETGGRKDESRAQESEETGGQKEESREEKCDGAGERKKGFCLSQRDRTGVRGGLCCGVLLWLSSSLQQFGVARTTVGKAGFITALYIILVPLLGLFLKKKVGLNVWISVGLAAVGMYLLCIREGFSISQGDFLVFLCSIGFSFHILAIDYFSPQADGLLISCVQFFTAGALAAVPTLIWEHPTWAAVSAAWLPILYAGVMSCGVAYTLQVVAQKDVEPTVASLILSMESVFSVLAGWVILGQSLSLKELGGCVLVFAGIILAQLPVEKLAARGKEIVK